MTRPHCSLAVRLFATIAVSGTLFAMVNSVVNPAEACPRSGLYSTGGSLTPTELNRADAAGSSGSVKPDKQSLNSFSSSSGNWYGIGAIAGLLAASAVYKVRSDRRAANSTDAVWLVHPELEHPELLLASVPSEALSNSALPNSVIESVTEQAAVLTR